MPKATSIMKRGSVLRSFPGISKLVWRLVTDSETPTYIRVGLVALGAYVVFPFDVVPDWIPLAGRVDDFLVVTVGLRQILRRVPPHKLKEHWDGKEADLLKILGQESL